MCVYAQYCWPHPKTLSQMEVSHDIMEQMRFRGCEGTGQQAARVLQLMAILAAHT